MTKDSSLSTPKLLSFLEANSWGDASISWLPADWSPRRFGRLHSPHSNRNAILLTVGDRNFSSPGDGLPRSRLGLQEHHNICAFVTAASILRNLGLSAPKIYASSGSFLIMEDLGNASTVDQNDRIIFARMLTGARAIAKLHDKFSTTPSVSSVNLPRFGKEQMLGTLRVFIKTCSQSHQAPADRSARDANKLQQMLGELIDEIFEFDSVGICLRDLQAANIRWLDEHEGTDRIGLIDIQDLSFGPNSYDCASYFADVRHDITPNEEAQLICHYLDASRRTFDKANFLAAYDRVKFLRHTRVFGQIKAILDSNTANSSQQTQLPKMLLRIAGRMIHPTIHDTRQASRHAMLERYRTLSDYFAQQELQLKQLIIDRK